MKRIFLPVLLLLSTIGLGPGVGGFETVEGVRWAGGRAPYWINPNFPQQEIAGDRAHQLAILEGAAEAWTAQTRADFQFQFRGSTFRDEFKTNDGINAVFWTPLGDPRGALATTAISRRPQGGLAFDMVFFASTFERENIWSGLGEPAGEALDIVGVAVHELGHALGLAHTPVRGATMNATITERGLPWRTLEADDRAGVEFLYTPLPGTPGPEVGLQSVVPPEGPVGGTNEVIIEGINFTYRSDTQLSVGGLSVDSSRWEVETPKRLRIFDMPPGMAGTVDISVLNSLGTAVLPGAYTYRRTEFVRGDANGDGFLDLSDATYALNHLFLGGPVPIPCIGAADANDDGSLFITDPVYVLNFLLLGGPPPPVPYPVAGVDTTPDPLGC